MIVLRNALCAITHTHTHGNEVATSVAGRGPPGGVRATVYSLLHRSGIFS